MDKLTELSRDMVRDDCKSINVKKNGKWKEFVAIVRCKDCKWYYIFNGHGRCDLLDLEARYIKPDWFCADGERREDAETG